MGSVKGIIRHIDDLGRVVIPKEMRKSMLIKEGDPVEIIMNGDSVTIKKHNEACYCCGSEEDLHDMPKLGIKLCPKCFLEIEEYASSLIKSLKEN